MAGGYSQGEEAGNAAPAGGPPARRAEISAPTLTAARARSLLALPSGEARVSLDLGVGDVEVSVAPEGVLVPGLGLLPRSALERAAAAPSRAVVRWDGEAFEPCVVGVCRLVATEGPPTVEISGVWMHRTAGTDPYRDGADRARAVVRSGDRVLDCCTGLGYAAIAAARLGARSVVTFEVNPDVAALLDLNPWSAPLLVSPVVDRRHGDVAAAIAPFGDASFDACVHDPPRFALAGELYSGAFYRQLARVLRRGGRLCHYTGDPGRGRTRLLDGIARRLGEAGFRDVRRDPTVGGFLATRG